jgi:hypothetical protein
MPWSLIESGEAVFKGLTKAMLLLNWNLYPGCDNRDTAETEERLYMH